MFKACKIGIGLAVVLGLMLAIPSRPVRADEACQRALANIDRAQTTLHSLQQLLDQIINRQTSTASAAQPMKCPACGMMMPTSPTATMTRAVKYNGITYYCCQGCDMSATADKE